jgi:hypothetical protein
MKTLSQLDVSYAGTCIAYSHPVGSGSTEAAPPLGGACEALAQPPPALPVLQGTGPVCACGCRTLWALL